MSSIIKEFNDNLVNHRLTIDKTNKYKVRNPVFNEITSEIDFKNYNEGGRYIVPAKSDDLSLEGEEYVMFDIQYDVRSGLLVKTPPRMMKFVYSISVKTEQVLLKPLSGLGIFSGACWTRQESVFVYSSNNIDAAILSYNEKVNEVKKLRREYLLSLVDKEMKELDKCKVELRLK